MYVIIGSVNMSIKRVQILIIWRETWACASCNSWQISLNKRGPTPGVGVRAGSGESHSNIFFFKLATFWCFWMLFIFHGFSFLLVDRCKFWPLAQGDIFYKGKFIPFFIFDIFWIPPAVLQSTCRGLRIPIWEPLSLSLAFTTHP